MTPAEKKALALLTELDALWGADKTVVVPTRALRAVLALARRVDGVLAHSLCPECGPNVACDEDGCCQTCGCTATGAALPLRVLPLAPKPKRRRKP